LRNKEAKAREEIMIKRIKVAELLLDYVLYPRERIDSCNVRQIAEALRAGVELPPIVVDKKSLRVVDGFHRVRAYQRVYGAVAEIPAELMTYKTDAAMFCDAVRLNARHGKQLSTYDQARCIAKAETYSLEPEVISSLLNMTIKRFSEMKMTKFATYKNEMVALKNTSAHLSGKDLTDGEAEYNARAGGMNQTFYINQVIAMLETDTVNWDNQNVTNAIKKLYDLLGKAMMVGV